MTTVKKIKTASGYKTKHVANSGVVTELHFNKSGKLHRTGGKPAINVYFERDPSETIVLAEAYFVNGKVTRRNHPAISYRTPKRTVCWLYVTNDRIEPTHGKESYGNSKGIRKYVTSDVPASELFSELVRVKQWLKVEKTFIRRINTIMGVKSS